MSRRGGDDPVPLADVLAALGAELGLPAGDSMRDLATHWSSVVGDDVAGHARLDSVRDGTMTITVDGPIWATQLRYLEAAIVERAAGLVGPGVVASVRVRVAGGEARR